MEQKRGQRLLKTLRGNNFRRAVKAIAELRMSSDPTTQRILLGLKSS
jgi:hypothetical protein